MSVIMDLREKRNKLWEEAKAFLKSHYTESGLVEASDVAQYDKMTADVLALGKEIERLEAQSKIDNEFSTMNFNLGNVIKYVARAGKKINEVYSTALQKAEWYLIRKQRRSYRGLEYAPYAVIRQ